MTEQQVNIPLLRKAVEWAEAEAAKPEAESRWRQNYWVTPVRDEIGAWGYMNVNRSAETAGRCGTCYCIAGYVVETDRGPTTERVPLIATDLLGLTSKQAAVLFDSCNTIEDVRRIAEDIAGERL